MRDDGAGHPAWVDASIGELVASDGLFTDGDWVETKDQDPEGTVRLIQLADIGDGNFLDKSARFLTRAKALALNCTFLAKGDLLVARLAEPLGRCCIFPLDGDEEYVTVVDVCVVRLGTSAIDPKYVMYAINGARTRADIETHRSGSTRKRVSRRNLARVTVPLAPGYEQRRIVAKIEELFSELDKGIESLKTARRQLEVYRQSVLKHAFEGKLTAQWREENKDKLETPEQLLVRIKKERVAHHEQQLAEWESAVRVWETNGKPYMKPTKHRKPAGLAKLKSSELAELPLLPGGHVYTYLAHLGELERGKSKHRPRNAPELFGGSYPFIQTGEVKAASRTIRHHSQTYSELGLEQSRLWPEGTLCITIAANIAETAFLGFDACFPDSIVGFTATKTLVLPSYVHLFIQSFRARIEAYAPATAQKNINLNTLQKLVVPLCSLEEQQVLVDRLEVILSVADEQERDIDRALVETEVLRQAILKKAFAGHLVAQDPSDEPASVFLEKIKTERAQAGKSNPTASSL